MVSFNEINKRSIPAIVLWSLFGILTIWWVLLHIFWGDNDNALQLFAATYGVVALWGGVVGIVISRHWGGIRSIFGKAILFFSLGLLFQEFGQLVYSFYIYFLQIDVPYPSIGDVGFFGSIIWYIFGVYYLGRAAGVKVGLQSWMAKAQAIVLPLSMLFLAYGIFLRGYEFDWTNPIQIFLDFGYPFGQAIYVSLALLVFLVSHNILGGAMRKPTRFILIALVVQFIADFSFLFLSSRDLWKVGGWNDYTYLVSYFLMGLALWECKRAFDSIRSS